MMGRICLECGSQLGPDSNFCPKDETHVVEPPDEALLGTTIADRYHILSIIGRGGMGVVYKARQIQVDRFVAVKMLHAHVAADPQGLKRFQHEAKACGALQHPNLVQVHDSGVVDEARPYLVMSYEEGESLSQILEREGVLAPQRAINIFMQVCDGLAHAHHKGIIHRDLKPGNILLTNSDMGPDFVKVVDFGIAKLLGPTGGKDSQSITKTGETFGSPWYMSPEQCVAQTLDARSDVYALGCVMYHALTGKPPLAGESAFETMTFHVSKRPPPFRNIRPDLRIMPDLEKAVFTALEKVPEERWQSMMDLKQRLRRVGQGVSVSVTSMPLPPPPPAPKEADRTAPAVTQFRVNPRVVALLIAVVLLLLAAVLKSVVR